MEFQDNSPLDTAETASATKDVPAKGKSKKVEQGPPIPSLLCFPALIVAVATIAMTILGFLAGGGSFGWFCEICASLRAQFVLVLLLCMLPALFAPPWRLPLLAPCALFALINLCFVIPPMLPASAPSDANLKFLKFRVMELHVDSPQTDLKPIIQEVNAEHPELVCITGVNTAQLVKLNEQLNSYLNRTAFMPEESKGIAIYSTKPLKGNRFRRIGPDKLPVLLTTLHFDYGWFRIIAIELPAPKDGDTLSKRNAQAEAVAKMVAELNGRKMVLGDYNMTPYSMTFGALLKNGNLQDTRLGYGIQPSWHYPDNMDLFLMRFPVDHILINSDVATMSRHVGEACGLAHRPIIVDLYPANSNQPKYEPSKESAPDDIPAAQALTPGAGVKGPPKTSTPTPAAEGKAPAETGKKGSSKRKRKH